MNDFQNKYLELFDAVIESAVECSFKMAESEDMKSMGEDVDVAYETNEEDRKFHIHFIA